MDTPIKPETPGVPKPSEAAPAPDAPASATVTAPVATPAAKARILIVDDEVAFTRMVKLNLEKAGDFEVRIENRAAGALAAARDFRPDLILLDVIMPSMDGGDVQNQMKRDRTLRDTPIIFLTATLSKREAGEGGLNSGGELFLAKPVTVENLVACINERIRKPTAS